MRSALKTITHQRSMVATILPELEIKMKTIRKEVVNVKQAKQNQITTKSQKYSGKYIYNMHSDQRCRKNLSYIEMERHH